MYLTILPTSPAALPPRSRPVEPLEVRSAVRKRPTALADLLQMAVDLNGVRALTSGVRVRGYARNDLLPTDGARATLKKVHDLLAHATRNAHRGSLVVAEVGLRGGDVEVQLRYARGGKQTATRHATLDWILEIWSWDPANVPDLTH
jgi:hypothetical protein